MTTRPTNSPAFATAATFTSGDESGLTPRVDPGAGFKAQGWYPNRRMPARWFNWLIGNLGDWAQYLAEKTDHEFNVLNFGADKTGSANSQPSIQNALDAALSAGSGRAIVPAGAYKLNSGLTVYRGVDLVMKPGAVLYLNDANANFITLGAGTYTGARSIISGGVFESLVANTGIVVFDPAGGAPRDLLIRGCAMNALGTNLQGRFLSVLGTATDVQIDDCYLKSGPSASGLVLADGTGCRVSLERSRIVAAATTTSDLVVADGGDVTLVDNQWDFSAHTTGAFNAFHAYSGTHMLRGNRYIGGSGTSTATAASAGAKIIESDPSFSGVRGYSIASALVSGSKLALLPPIAATTGGSGPFDLSASTSFNGREALYYELQNNFGGGGPSITLPTIFFTGQRFALTLMNSSGAGWTIVSFSNAAGANSGPIADGYGRTFEFVATDTNNNGSPYWVMAHDPSAAYPVF